MDIIMCLFIVHIVLMIVLIILKMLGIVEIDFMRMFVAFLVPIWGPCIAWFSRDKEKQKYVQKDIDVSRMDVDEIRKSVNVDDKESDVVPINEALAMNDNTYLQKIIKDLLYDVKQSIKIDMDDVFEKVVPLNEALVINDSATRRALIMDVLYTNPSDYIAQLTEAKKNDDTEVVHYAVTALVEMQKQFDLKFQQLFRRREEEPDNEQLNIEYMKLLERYISCGLLEGEGLITQLKNYKNLLLEMIDKDKRTWAIQCKLADTDLKLKDAKSLNKDIKEMEVRWPERETTYLFRIKLGILKRDAEEIRKAIKEIKEKDMYISEELRGLVQFWDESNE